MTKGQWTIKFMLKHKLTFFLGFLIVTLMTLINLSYPFLNGKIINIAFYNRDMTAFLNLFFIYFAILFFNQFIVATLNNIIASQLMTGFLFDIRRALFQKILHKRGKDLSGMYSRGHD